MGMQSLRLGRSIMGAAVFVGLAISFAGCNPSPEAPKQTDGKKPGSAADAGAKPSAITALKMDDTKVGTGDAVTEGDLLFVRYKGTLADGKVFDSNTDEGKPIFSFTAGPTGTVIDGWKKGVIGMKAGGTRKLSIPWSMAYGEGGTGTIPPKADLFFEIQLIRVMKKGEEMTVTKKDLKPGSGRAVKTGDKVEVNFDGKVIGGDEIEKGKYIFTVGKDEVIPGIDAGVIGMKVGGVRKLTLPPNTAFGPMGREPIVPPNSFVEYELTLLGFK